MSAANAVIRHLRRQLGPPLSDTELLGAYVERRSEEAFRSLIERHGPMVLGICRRRLGNAHAADDAFQATFLALVRSAESVRSPQALAAWLSRTALRICGKEQVAATRRHVAENRQPACSPADALAGLTARELFDTLDIELNRLPERYRVALCLVYWQGLPHTAAARNLGLSAGALQGRLDRGRQRLAERLRGRGMTLPVLLVAPLASVAVSGELLARTTALALPGAAIPAVVLTLATTAGATKMLSIAGLTVIFVSVGLIGLASDVGSPAPGKKAADFPNPALQPPVTTTKPLVDTLGDPLPDGALRRFGTTRFRHGEQIFGLAITADGRTIATSGYGEIRLWDADSGRLRRILRTVGHVFSLSFTADGQQLVSAGGKENKPPDRWNPGELKIWEVSSGQVIRTVTYRNPDRLGCWIRVAAITPDGKSIVMSCADGALQIRDATTGDVRHDLGANDRPGNALALSSDGKLLAATGTHGAVCVWDVATGALKQQLPDASHVQALAFSRDGSALASAHGRGLIDGGPLRMWDLATGRLLWTESLRGVSALAFSPDGRWLANGNTDSTTELRDAKSGKIIHEHKGQYGQTNGVAFSPDGKTLYAAGTESRVQIWDTTTGEERSPVDKHAGGVIGLAQSTDGQTLATVSGDRTIRLWDLASGRTRRILNGPQRNDYSVQFLRDGQRLVSAGGEGKVRSWDVATGLELEKLFETEKGWYARVVLSPDGRHLAIGEVQRVVLWDVATSKLVREIRGHTGYIIDLSFSPNGDYLATAAHGYTDGAKLQDDWTVRVWNVSTGDELFQSRHEHASSISFTPDGRGVMFLDGSNKVHVFDFLTGQKRADSGWHDVTKLAHSPGGSWLATAHTDGTVRVRSASTGQDVLRFQADAGAIHALLWSADGKALYSANGDTTVLELSLAPSGSPGELSAEKAWVNLASADGPTAYRAAWWFKSVGESVHELTARLRPAPDDGKAEHAMRLVAKLDDDLFTARESAAKELSALGQAAKPALTHAALSGLSPEVRKRARTIIAGLPPPSLNAEDWRTIRAVEILEHIATPPAREYLSKLAAGAAGARLTEAATTAVKRLGQK